MFPFRPQNLKTVLTHVGVGMGAASFWRGAWYILDDHLFPASPEHSALASLSLGTVGMFASQGLVGRIERLTAKKPAVPALRVSLIRFGALYSIALSVVLVWRGTWVGWDCLYERLHSPSINAASDTTTYLASSQQEERQKVNATDPGHATKSGVLSHFVAIGLLLGTGLFASVLAPPAAISVIRDLTVKAGGNSYAGPGQAVANQLFGRGRTPTASASRVFHSSRRLLNKRS
jgi:hypothetical protein